MHERDTALNHSAPRAVKLRNVPVAVAHRQSPIKLLAVVVDRALSDVMVRTCCGQSI